MAEPGVNRIKDDIEPQIEELEKPIEDKLVKMKEKIDELYKKLQDSLTFDYEQTIKDLKKYDNDIEKMIHQNYRHEVYRLTPQEGKEEIYFLTLESMKILTNLFRNNFNKVRGETDNKFKDRLSEIYDKFTIDVKNFSKKYENTHDKEFIEPYKVILDDVNKWFTDKFSITANRILDADGDSDDRHEWEANKAAEEEAEKKSNEELKKNYIKIDKKILENENFDNIIKDIDVFIKENSKIKNIGKFHNFTEKKRTNFDFYKHMNVTDITTIAQFKDKNENLTEIPIRDTYRDIDASLYIKSIDEKKLKTGTGGKPRSKRTRKNTNKKSKNTRRKSIRRRR